MPHPFSKVRKYVWNTSYFVKGLHKRIMKIKIKKQTNKKHNMVGYMRLFQFSYFFENCRNELAMNINRL